MGDMSTKLKAGQLTGMNLGKVLVNMGRKQKFVVTTKENDTRGNLWSRSKARNFEFKVAAI